MLESTREILVLERTLPQRHTWIDPGSGSCSRKTIVQRLPDGIVLL
jgi:hypothetical protein